MVAHPFGGGVLLFECSQKSLEVTEVEKTADQLLCKEELNNFRFLGFKKRHQEK